MDLLLLNNTMGSHFQDLFFNEKSQYQSLFFNAKNQLLYDKNRLPTPLKYKKILSNGIYLYSEN